MKRKKKSKEDSLKMQCFDNNSWLNEYLKRSCRRHDPIVFQNKFKTSQRKIVAATSEESLQQESSTKNEAILRI